MKKMKGKLMQIAPFVPFLIMAVMAGAALYLLLKSNGTEVVKPVVSDTVTDTVIEEKEPVCNSQECVDVDYYIDGFKVRRRFMDEDLTQRLIKYDEEDGVYNHFTTQKHAEEALRRLKQVLVDYKEEINEEAMGKEGN